MFSIGTCVWGVMELYYVHLQNMNQAKPKRMGRNRRFTPSLWIRAALFSACLCGLFLSWAMVQVFAVESERRAPSTSAYERIIEYQQGEIIKRYVVEPGDTLWDIAATHAPDNTDVRQYVYQLTMLNGMESSHIDVGQILLLP